MPQAGLGQVTVRAQIQAIVVAVGSCLSARRRSSLRGRGRRCAPWPGRASTRRSGARPRRGRSRAASRRAGVGGAGEHGRPAGELRRDLDQRLVDEHRDGVEVGGVGLQPEALGLERDGAAAGERVEDRGRLATGRLQDLLRAPREQRLVVDVLPFDEPLDDPVQPLTLRALRLLGRELVGSRGRVVDELREEHRACRGQRSPRPPEVQRRRVAVPDRLLPRRLAVDRPPAAAPPRSASASARSSLDPLNPAIRI